MRVIGTAGHVDHGKSTLIKRLTGIDPDRLAEEKTREMTIDLGFAWMDLPHGETIGIVDVPGHRDFIENMLAGVGGIEAVILVIAADEGIMPQTREHLAILDLLEIHTGLVAMTKIDVVNDPDWLELVQTEIIEALAGSSLENAPIYPVSARTGEGLLELIYGLRALLDTLPARTTYRPPHLPIDRVFTISGFGTVVTGTLQNGVLHVGDEIEVQPEGLTGRIRGLQVHKSAVISVEPGTRVAVNIAGINKTDVTRGQVIALPGYIHPSSLIDVRFRQLPDVPRALKHNTEVKFFSGTAESTGRVRLLSDEELAPGAHGWLQVRLDKPLALTSGDRYILRYPSPGETIGGGIVIDAHPSRRWKRFQKETIERLEIRMRGTPGEQLASVAEHYEILKLGELQKHAGLEKADFRHAFDEALERGLISPLSGELLIATGRLEQIRHQITQTLTEYHQSQQLRLGMLREELRSKLGIKLATLNAVLEQSPHILIEQSTVRLATHEIIFAPEQERRRLRLQEVLTAAPYTPPSFAEAAQMAGEDVLYALIDLGEVVQVTVDVIFSRHAYNQMVATALDLIDQTGSVNAAALRDHFQTSRKFAIGLLEHLDAVGITKRIGDNRVRGRAR